MKIKPFKLIYHIIIAGLAVIAMLLVISVLPLTNNFKILSVLSGSMEPTLHTGSIVVIKPASDYQVGDIITFRHDPQTDISVTHRISEIKETAGGKVYITKGDANNNCDAKEDLMSDIVGKVLFSVPYFGYAVDFTKKPVGFMLIIVIPAVIIIYDEIHKIKDEIIKMKNKKRQRSKEQEAEYKKSKE